MRIFDHEPPPPHSVLKLFIDLFNNDVTAGLFYTNDVKVLIDIILRQLYDMFPGDKVLRNICTCFYPSYRNKRCDIIIDITAQTILGIMSTSTSYFKL